MIDELKRILDNAKKDLDSCTNESQLSVVYLKYNGGSGIITTISKKLKDAPASEKRDLGKLFNLIKSEFESSYIFQKKRLSEAYLSEKIDVSAPGIKPALGHLHIVSQAIDEIESIFKGIGFSRVRYNEVEWDWYSFESLNIPAHHPARDDIETFFIDNPPSKKYGRMLLSPHTSSGQVREMQRVRNTLPAGRQAPIRMINIAKCYRPNWDVTHTPMFHQFEGLVVDEGINITHLKGTMDYFVKEFFGNDRKTRLRPFHFQFTEPSFEVDITCGVCDGKGKLNDGSKCRFCKEGWLELGGSGMVHPNVLRFGGIDSKKYSGFAFGWGVERVYMMKSGTMLDDIRLLYGNDIRFLEQF